MCLYKSRSVQHSVHQKLMGLKLLTVQLLTHHMNVSEAANRANRRGLIERVSRGQTGKIVPEKSTQMLLSGKCFGCSFSVERPGAFC